MFERFTDRARRVVVLAQEEARLLDHNYIGTEHILLGLIHEEEGIAAQALEALEISLDEVRAQVEEIIGRGPTEPAGHIPFTPRAKKVLEYSLREALQLGHNYIGTEHILLGLIREGEGVAAQVLVELGADLSRVRQQVIQLLSGYGSRSRRGAEAGATLGLRPPRATIRSRRAPRCFLCGRREQRVTRVLVAGGFLLCDECIRDAARQLDSLETEEGKHASRFRRRVVEPDDRDVAVAAIEAAFAAVFGADQLVPEEAMASIEQGDDLVEVVREMRVGASRFPDFVNDITVERVRFVDAEEAEVDLAIWVAGATTPTRERGHAVLVDGDWRVSRETLCRFAERAGVACPPEA
jgi:hypothetical protein